MVEKFFFESNIVQLGPDALVSAKKMAVTWTDKNQTVAVYELSVSIDMVPTASGVKPENLGEVMAVLIRIVGKKGFIPDQDVTDW